MLSDRNIHARFFVENLREIGVFQSARLSRRRCICYLF